MQRSQGIPQAQSQSSVFAVLRASSFSLLILLLGPSLLLTGCLKAKPLPAKSENIEGKKEPVQEEPLPPGSGSASQMSAAEVVSALNAGKVDLSGGLNRLHSLLVAEKDPLELKTAYAIAEAADTLTVGSDAVNVARILGIPSEKYSGLFLGVFTPTPGEKPWERAWDDLFELLQTEQTPLHTDAFLIHYLTKHLKLPRWQRSLLREESKLWGYFKVKTTRTLDTAFLSRWNEESQEGHLLSVAGAAQGDIDRHCQNDDYLEHPRLDSRGQLAAYRFQDEEWRYLKEVRIPNDLIMTGRKLLAQYAELEHLIHLQGVDEKLQGFLESWFIAQMRTPVHLVGFSSAQSPIQNISGQNEEATASNRLFNAFLSNYLSTWVRRLGGNGSDVPSSYKLTTRLVQAEMSLIEDSLARGGEQFRSNADLETFRASTEIAMDVLNILVDRTPIAMEWDRRASCHVQGNSQFSTLEVNRVGEFTDERFYKILAPYWKWLLSSGILGRPVLQVPAHPLNRIYLYRAALDFFILNPQQTQLAVSPDDIKGLLGSRVAPSIEPKSTGRLGSVESFLREYEQVELTRLALEVAKAEDLLSPAPTLVWGTEEMRRDLLGHIQLALKHRFHPQIEAAHGKPPGQNSFVKLEVVESMVPEVSYVSLGDPLHINISASHLNIPPGVYSLKSGVAISAKSIFVHPLAIAYGPGKGGRSGISRGTWGWWIQPRPGQPGKRVELLASEDRVLNDFSWMMANLEAAHPHPIVGIPPSPGSIQAMFGRVGWGSPFSETDLSPLLKEIRDRYNSIQ